MSHTGLTEQRAIASTMPSSREIDISSITNRAEVIAIEYPINESPRRYQCFALWADILTILGDEVPDGSNAYIYYSEQPLTRKDRVRLRPLYKPYY
jgi:hypothetical protein